MKIPTQHARLAICCTAVALSINVGEVFADTSKSASPAPLTASLTVDPVTPITRSHEVHLSGHALPRQRVTVTGGLKKVDEKANSQGDFRIEVQLTRDQVNQLTVSVEQPAAAAGVTIIQDETGPQISVTSRAERTLLRNPVVRLTGEITDNLSGIAQLACDKSPASISGSQFACDVELKHDGSHTIDVWGSDRAGNVSVTHHRVSLWPQLPGGDSHTTVVSADINSDGHLDVARTNFLNADVSILLSNADGTFKPERRVAVGEFPSSLAIADINGDGILDIITTHYAAGEVAIQYGQANGSYVAGPRIKVDAFPSAIAVADMNHDGVADFITAHMDSREVRVYLARRDGSFSPQSSRHAHNGPIAIAVGDVDGDGKLDVVVANYESNDVSVFRGRGDGRFHSDRRFELSAAAVGPNAIVLADLNDDGNLDIVTANFASSDASLLIADGSGLFQPAQRLAIGTQPVAIAAKDVTHDAKLDLITAELASDDLWVSPNLGNGSFGAVQRLVTPPEPAPSAPTRPTQNIPVSDPTTSPVFLTANAIGAFAVPVRTPAPGLPAPLDRIGMSFGNGTSSYPDLLGANGMSYPPLVAMGHAGVKWIRLEGDANYFRPGSIMTFQSIAAVVDRLIAQGFSVHMGVTDFRYFPTDGKPYPADFPNAQFLAEFAQFAADLARATNRPGRVVFEVWNEPNLLGVFWPAKRDGVNEAKLFAKLLTQTTEAIHLAAPGATVIAGGLFSYYDSYAVDMMAEYNRLLAGHPAAAVDRFGLHPYPNVDHDMLRSFQHDLTVAGLGAVPIDITEMGGWWNSREWVGAWDADNLLRGIEEDVGLINLWGALSSTGDDRLGGFMDVAAPPLDNCHASAFGEVRDITGYVCHPAMYGLKTFSRVARGRTYQGALFDSRTHALPGFVVGDPLSGLRALKFESADDTVIAVYTMDRSRASFPGSGRTYSIAFPEAPVFVSSYSGQDFPSPDATGHYKISHDSGPLYFFFSKTGNPPVETVNARAICADGSLPLRGQIQFWHTVFPVVTPGSELDWQSPGVTSAAALSTVSRQLQKFYTNMYVGAEVVGSSPDTYLPMRSAVQTGGGAGAPIVVGGTYFNPLTPMAQLSAPSLAAGVYDINFLALPEWCTP